MTWHNMAIICFPKWRRITRERKKIPTTPAIFVIHKIEKPIQRERKRTSNILICVCARAFVSISMKLRNPNWWQMINKIDNIIVFFFFKFILGREIYLFCVSSFFLRHCLVWCLCTFAGSSFNCLCLKLNLIKMFFFCAVLFRWSATFGSWSFIGHRWTLFLSAFCDRSYWIFLWLVWYCFQYCHWWRVQLL